MLKTEIEITLLYSILITILIFSIFNSCESIAQEKTTKELIMSLATNAPNNPVNKDGEFLNNLIATIEDCSIKYDIPIPWIVVIIFKESSFKMKSIGYKGKEIGLMQVYPSTAKAFKCSDMESIEGQINCGCKVLRFCIDRCNGDFISGLTAYASKHRRCKAKKGSRLERAIKNRIRIHARITS